MRTVIIGNSGSGKTWLTRHLSEKSGDPAVHLDEIFWLPGGFNEKRDPIEVARLLDAKKAGDKWIVEGVYGNLVEQFLPAALTLVWLDIPWQVCTQRLEYRGSESKTHMDRKQSNQGLEELVRWAKDYPIRQGFTGEAAHFTIFEAFQGTRLRLRSEAEIWEYLDTA